MDHSPAICGDVPFACSSRQAAGAPPFAFLDARLNAASESYPTSDAASDTFAVPWLDDIDSLRTKFYLELENVPSAA